MKCFILPAHKTFAFKPVKCHYSIKDLNKGGYYMHGNEFTAICSFLCGLWPTSGILVLKCTHVGEKCLCCMGQFSTACFSQQDETMVLV